MSDVIVGSYCSLKFAYPLDCCLTCDILQVKDYRRQSSPAQGVDGMRRGSLGCLAEDFEGEAEQRQDVNRQVHDKQTEFVVPRSRSRTNRSMNDETNVPRSCLPCKRNLLESAHCLRSRLPSQVHYSYIVVMS